MYTFSKHKQNVRMIGMYDPGANVNLWMNEKWAGTSRNLNRPRYQGWRTWCARAQKWLSLALVLFANRSHLTLSLTFELRECQPSMIHYNQKTIINGVCRTSAKSDNLNWIDEDNYNLLIASILGPVDEMCDAMLQLLPISKTRMT